MADALDAVMAIMEEAFDPQFGEAWNRNQVSGALALPNTFLLLVDTMGAPYSGMGQAAGFALSRGAADEEELLLLAVSPAYRGRGIGAALMDRFIAEAYRRGAARLFLEMREGNAAERLYRRFDFREIGRRRNYYSSGSKRSFDALTFAREKT